MAALPDQTENVPLLDITTEQRSTAESSQQSINDLGRRKGKSLKDTFQPLFPDETPWSILRIVGGFVIAGELAIAHYAFLRFLHGRNIDEYPQVWIKGANNGFSNLFSVFVALSAGTALTHIKWRASGNKPLRIYTIDNLFALPAPLALLKTLMHPRGSLFFPILSSVLIHGLLLVNILAPSALTVAPSEQVSRDIDVPILNLTSQAQFAYTSADPHNLSVVRINLTPLGEQRISSVLLNLPEVTWTIPQPCGLTCSFSFQYVAPGLECHDVVLDASQYSHVVGTSLDAEKLYEASTNLYPQNATASHSQQMDVGAPYDLSINYTTVRWVPGNLTVFPSAGIYCRFYRATYNASFEFTSNGRRASTSIISHGGYLTGHYPRDFVSLNRVREEDASWAICYAFAGAFRKLTSQAHTISQTNPVLASIFDLNTTSQFFTLTVANLGQAVVDLFSNLTLGLILTRDGHNTVIANGTIWDGSSIWISTTWILWVAYLPALILAINAALYGLYTIHLSGIAMDDKFSTFLLATRNADLDKMCGEATNFQELEKIQLIHQNKGTFLVVDSSFDSPS